MARANSTEETPAATRAAMAEGLAIEAGRLARIARDNDFPLLAYLIEMAVLEAWREASDVDVGPGSAGDPCLG